MKRFQIYLKNSLNTHKRKLALLNFGIRNDIIHFRDNSMAQILTHFLAEASETLTLTGPPNLLQWTTSAYLSLLNWRPCLHYLSLSQEHEPSSALPQGEIKVHVIRSGKPTSLTWLEGEVQKKIKARTTSNCRKSILKASFVVQRSFWVAEKASLVSTFPLSDRDGQRAE